MGEENSTRATEESEQHAFGEKLAQNAAAPGTERGADGNFAFARCRSGEHQVGHVGASNQENESNRSFMPRDKSSRKVTMRTPFC